MFFVDTFAHVSMRRCR